MKSPFTYRFFGALAALLVGLAWKTPVLQPTYASAGWLSHCERLAAETCCDGREGVSEAHLGHSAHHERRAMRPVPVDSASGSPPSIGMQPGLRDGRRAPSSISQHRRAASRVAYSRASVKVWLE